MSGIARTSATGGEGMLPELLAWSTSLHHDRAFVREDLLGSAAHVTMLARTRLVEVADAQRLREALLSMYADAEAGTLALPDGEEDVHMAVEAELGRRLGAVAGRLHTARSRNDQVALDLRLHVRGQVADALQRTTALVTMLSTRANDERETLIPAYTHRQRAQPTSVGFRLCAWASQLLRGAECLAFGLARADRLPLGSGACSGSSLPIDRNLTSFLLAFSQPTLNALDTVGDRDFALDFAWGATRVMVALSRLSTDVIDYATSEFGYVKLDGRIAAGSSMMPQKKNPDVFELVRGQSARAIGNVMSLLTLVKGLPNGYNRDLQEDRAALLSTGPLLRGALDAVTLALPHVTFDGVKSAAALADGSTQATDLAEALVRKGVPFREAYKAVGALVRRAIDDGIALSQLDPAVASALHPALDAEALRALDPAAAMRAKESIGGTGPRAVAEQIEALRAGAEALAVIASNTPTLANLAARIAAEPLEPA
ncbi:MAG: argininosuccinate lyase [Deltaproteobacteria bacterium]|nr:argininosuccinate lyase [Deltaproteobacteria bacterium]